MTFSLLSLLLAVGLCWVVGAYSRLQRLRSQVVQAFGALDVHGVRLLALLGEFQAAWVPPLGSTPLNPCAAESAALQAATVQMGACLAVARSQPLDAAAMAALSSALEVQQAAWRAWVQCAAVAWGEEASGLAPWLARWVDQQGQQALATRVFNFSVQHYNQAITQCPACLLAWGLGYRPAGPLPEPQEVLPHEA